ncbi:citrate synthase [Phyllobacterium myrsinacearum]|uniref:citrate synthase (unknown stereospecificity) n=1 Tax=Phyllobacterium myrsinacearum TaxID=28101 RepID=A0A2S9JBF0_9HYPH|nr:citrate synthase [Phyllobacterium myrsinacearum]PRD50149.1 citrate synthase [Phyllobacterium myrsinacearum]PWV90796.1 citrate synthase [Phyllobacterium myrsinacearum]RZU97198.1 citrate synthase [Phyllobacterium myrsinacearum]
MAWLTASQALAALGVQPQTLYANVSRGRIQAKPDPQDPRRSLYKSEDVKRLAGRKAGRRTVANVAAEAIGWGDPVLPSSISTIADGRLWYRGRDASALAVTSTLEQVAALLWETDGIAFPLPAHAVHLPDRPLEAAMVALARRAATDLPAYGRSRAVLIAEASGILADVVAAMLGADNAGLPVHIRLARLWQAPAAEDCIRRALVLLADHELNASTFAARVAASTGAPLSAGMLAGLATLTGPLHGEAYLSVQALARSAQAAGTEHAVRESLAQGRAIPAFAHPLYPMGDERARALLEQFKPGPVYQEIRAVTELLTGEQPNIDFALAAMTDAFALPPPAPVILFAIARSVGWIAHILEQQSMNQLIRPRARYTGPPLSMT